MGCDIHTLIEYKHPRDTHYQWFASSDLKRDYILFALIAGVRSALVKQRLGYEVVPLFAPRGIPDGSTSDRDWILSESLHSHSWLSTDELKQVQQAYLRIIDSLPDAQKSEYGSEPDLELKATIRAMEVLPNARLVFYFDNYS